MLEITNKTKQPVQLVIRSKKAPKAFTVLNIPGVGLNKNTFLLEEERSTDYIYRAEQKGLIKIKKILNKEGE
jgi:hypothetical protein